MALNISKSYQNKFRSKGEAVFYSQCKAAGLEPDYENKNDVIEYIIPESKHKYNPDFTLQKIAGGKMIIEYKGMWELADRKKHLELKRQFPNLDIRIIFEKPQNKIKKGSSTTYGAWCNAKGIKWAAKKMPAAWINECVKRSTTPKQVSSPPPLQTGQANLGL